MPNSQIPETLEEMLTLSNPRTVYQNQVRLARMKFTNACVLGHNMGEFRIDAVFLAYLRLRLEAGIDRAVMLDTNNVPILIEDIEDLLDTADSQYHVALNEYFDEIQRLKSSRKPEKMVEING